MGRLFLACLACLLSTGTCLRCYTDDSCSGEPGVCMEECAAKEVCHFSFHSFDGTVAVDNMGCRALDNTEEHCKSTQCLVQSHPIGLYFCCCNSSDCNAIDGFYNTQSFTPPPPPSPSGSPPPSLDGMATCVHFECDDGSCTIDYEVCHGYCQAKYRRNEQEHYELASSNCITSTNSSFPNKCTINSSGSAQNVSCNCTGIVCNSARKIYFTDDTSVVSSVDRVCEEMHCSHFCIRYKTGARACECREGYRANGNNCMDIDECSGVNECEMNCTNTEGSYKCSCSALYTLNEDGRSCKEIEFACAKNPLCPPDDFECLRVTACTINNPACYVQSVNNETFIPTQSFCITAGPACGASTCEVYEVSGRFTCCCTTSRCTEHINFTSLLLPPPTTVQTTLETHTTASGTNSTKSATTYEYVLKIVLPVVLVMAVLIVIVAVLIYWCCYRSIQNLSYHMGSIELGPPTTDQINPANINISSKTKVGSGKFGVVYKATCSDYPGYVAIKDYLPTEKARHGCWVVELLQAIVVHGGSTDSRAGGGQVSHNIVHKKATVKLAPKYRWKLCRGVWLSASVKECTVLESFNRELDILTTLEFQQHPNIVRLLGRDPTFQHLWIILSYEVQGSIQTILSSDELLTWEKTLNLVITMLRGLVFLQKMTISHRDIKSSNILVSNWTCKIADFGLALQFPLENDSPGSQVGTPRYMAVELIQGSMNTFNFRAYTSIDIYAAGLVMWELLSRTHPPLGTDPSNVLPYALPFQEYLQTLAITVDDMANLFKQNNPSLRPTIMSYFLRDAQYDELIKVIQDTWCENPTARIASTCCLERLESSFTFSHCSSSSSSLEIDYREPPTNAPVTTTTV